MSADNLSWLVSEDRRAATEFATVNPTCLICLICRIYSSKDKSFWSRLLPWNWFRK